jgi:hypothetical protein
MENRINHIIARVLSGESSSDDILSLSEWLNENEKNRDEFRRLKNYWDADVAFKHSVAPAFSADKLQQKINVQRRQTARRQLWRNAIPLIAAACLLFIFSTALFLYNTNDRISEHYTLLTDEHTSNFTMEDGTIITLNKNSRLSYSDKYGKDSRNVKLEGEAYFEVAKDPSKPFQVEMNGASITVLGTREGRCRVRRYHGNPCGRFHPFRRRKAKYRDDPKPTTDFQPVDKQGGCQRNRHRHFHSLERRSVEIQIDSIHRIDRELERHLPSRNPD